MYEIYDNCEISNNSPYHLQSQQNLFKGLQGRPMESQENYKIYENCEIYDNSPYHYKNCEIYNNSPYHLQTQRNVLKILV